VLELGDPFHLFGSPLAVASETFPRFCHALEHGPLLRVASGRDQPPAFLRVTQVFRCLFHSFAL
jgi:hypothetical protein